MPDTIVVSGDYTSTCLWTSGGRPIEFDELQIPRDLKRKIEDWNRRLYGENGKEAGWGKPEYEAEGIEIAAELQRFLGAAYSIKYIATDHAAPAGQVVYRLAPDGSMIGKEIPSRR